ncbi:MerR family transcriptional regulator [Mycolicibacterium goodii]|uniref:MerR family transcriptional regulator n=1 Tax=Mycolicibacterium goodii TaxID=134601 RepID=UPI001BDC3A28|nr:MerR family transcriptional regulator [Mycolicibacterium goodii]MBU8829763.1 MerR family transcriptional regulator [Mycolicibacterium goodii]
MKHGHTASGLHPGASIGEAAALFGVAPSTLRWWEQERVIPAPKRKGTRRVYGHSDLRRIGLAYLCSVTGMMSLPDAAIVTSGQSSNGQWRATVSGQISEIDRRIRRLSAARDYLEHLLACTDDDPAEQCPYLEGELVRHTPRGRVADVHLVDAAHAARDVTSSTREETSQGPRCGQCGGALPQATTGRRRTYCSAACRQRAYRGRAGARG